MKLTRYWFVIHPPDRFGPKNLGVTAYSIHEAKKLVTDSINKLGLQQSTVAIDDKTEIIENIDVRLLDKRHVIPNMGVVTLRGIWYPNPNVYSALLNRNGLMVILKQ